MLAMCVPYETEMCVHVGSSYVKLMSKCSDPEKMQIQKKRQGVCKMVKTTSHSRKQNLHLDSGPYTTWPYT